MGLALATRAWAQHPAKSTVLWWAGAAAGITWHSPGTCCPSPRTLDQGEPCIKTHSSAPCLSYTRQPVFFACRGCWLSLMLSQLLAGSSTHLAGGDRPGTGPCPKRGPHCRSNPPAWLALAGGWCTAERGADQASVGCRGNMSPSGRTAAEPAQGTTQLSGVRG